jgi:hypothetical protein
MHATEEVEDIGDRPRNVTARTESAILDDAPAPVIEPPAPRPAKASKAKPAVVDIEPVPVAADDGDIFG